MPKRASLSVLRRRCVGGVLAEPAGLRVDVEGQRDRHLRAVRPVRSHDWHCASSIGRVASERAPMPITGGDDRDHQEADARRRASPDPRRGPRPVRLPADRRHRHARDRRLRGARARAGRLAAGAPGPAVRDRRRDRRRRGARLGLPRRRAVRAPWRRGCGRRCSSTSSRRCSTRPSRPTSRTCSPAPASELDVVARADRARPDRPPRRDARARRRAARVRPARSRWTTSAPTTARSR